MNVTVEHDGQRRTGRWLAWLLSFSVLGFGVAGKAPAGISDTPSLVRALDSRDWTGQQEALAALRERARTEPAALVALTHALKHRSWMVRHGAAQALGALGPVAAPAVPALREALKDPDWLVRLGAAQALGRLGPAAVPALDALIQARADADPVVRDAARAALKDLAEHVPSVRETIQRALGSK